MNGRTAKQLRTCMLTRAEKRAYTRLSHTDKYKIKVLIFSDPKMGKMSLSKYLRMLSADRK